MPGEAKTMAPRWQPGGSPARGYQNNCQNNLDPLLGGGGGGGWGGGVNKQKKNICERGAAAAGRRTHCSVFLFI